MGTQSTLAEAVLRRCANDEPRLNDLLADPIVHLLMSSDRVRSADVQELLAVAKRERCTA